MKPGNTFFPTAWSREQVVAKIYEAYDNFIKSGAQNFEKTAQGYDCIGHTNEGIQIQFHITKTGEVSSCYPILEVKS